MTKTLIPPGGGPQILAATTTAKLALRIKCTFQAISDHLPIGLDSSPAVELLLALYVAEEDARYLVVSDLRPSGSLRPGTTERWLRALEQHDLVDRKGDMLALSSRGHETITRLLEAVYATQRGLD